LNNFKHSDMLFKLMFNR